MLEYKINESDIKRYIDKYGANERLIMSLVRYAEYQLPPGGALTGILECDLRKFMSNAGPDALLDLSNLWKFVYNVLPSRCWGSPQEVAAHLNGEG